MSITIESLKIKLAILNKQIEELKESILDNKSTLESCEKTITELVEIVKMQPNDFNKVQIAQNKVWLKSARKIRKSIKNTITQIRKSLAAKRKQIKAIKQQIRELKNPKKIVLTQQPVIVKVIEPVVVPNVVISTLDCPVCLESKNDTEFFSTCKNNHKLCRECFKNCAYTQLQDPSNANGDIENICKCPMCRQKMRLPGSIGENTHLFMYTLIFKYSMLYTGSDETIRNIQNDELFGNDKKLFQSQFDLLEFIMETRLNLKTETDFEKWLLEYFDIDCFSGRWRYVLACELTDAFIHHTLRI